jgi:molybdopterin converting factor subunit 1
MRLKLKYFGALSETTGMKEETMNLHSEITVEALRTMLEKKYPGLKNKSYQCAVDLKLQENNYKINKDSEIAFLPPFAGG